MQSFNWQTVDRDSPFTTLDFRTKLTMMIMVTLIAFTWESPIAGGLLTLIVALACLWAGVKWSYLLTILKFMAPFYLFLLITMGFFNVEQVKNLTGKTELTPLLTVGSTQMTVEGTLYGLNEEIIRLISAKKKEPEFMLDFRLRAYHQWQKKNLNQ